MHRPALSGPSGFPQPRFRLVGTALAVHPCTASSRFSPENRPGRNPVFGG